MRQICLVQKRVFGMCHKKKNNKKKNNKNKNNKNKNKKNNF